MIGALARLRHVTAIVIAVTASVAAVGCGHRQPLSSVLPHRSSFPSARYSESHVLKCLLVHHVLAGDQTLENVRAGLAASGAIPDGLTGQIPVTGAGSAATPLGKALGSGKPTSGVSFGPPMNSVTLVFFKSQRLAEKGAKRLVEDHVLRIGLTKAQKLLFNDLYGPPPPLSAIPHVVVLAGNVLVIWKYPLAHVTLSNRILGRCLAVSTA